MKRALLILTTALLLVAPAAEADHGPEVDRRILNVARAYWGVDKPCAHVAWATPGEEGGYSPAWAAVGGCGITLNGRAFTSMRRAQRCETIVHEYGHLLGYGHPKVPTIMNPMRLGDFKPCVRRPLKGFSFRPARLARCAPSVCGYDARHALDRRP